MYRYKASYLGGSLCSSKSLFLANCAFLQERNAIAAERSLVSTEQVLVLSN